MSQPQVTKFKKKLTKIQEAICSLLADGKRHTKEEIKDLCCGPCSMSNVSQHVQLLRPKLPDDQAIVCETANKITYYRWVILLVAGAYEETTSGNVHNRTNEWVHQ